MESLASAPVEAVALFRVVLGITALTNAVNLAANAPLWLLDCGVAPSRIMLRPVRSRLSLFSLAPVHDAVTLFAIGGHVVSCFAVCVGYQSSGAAAVAWLTLTALHARNTNILYGGDALLRMLLLAGAMLPLGEAFSIDRWLSHHDLGFDRNIVSVGVVFVRVQIAIVYIHTALYKVTSPAWRSGDAVGVALRQVGIRRFPMPSVFFRPLVLRVATYATLILEFLLPVGLLTPSLATGAVVVAILFHMCLDYVLSVHLFSWIMIAAITLCLPVVAPSASLDGAIGPLWLLSAVLAYLMFAALWPLCARLAPAAVRVWVRRLWLEQRWNMFMVAIPAVSESTMLLSLWKKGVRECSEFVWHGPQASVAGAASLSHRFLKYEASVSRGVDMAALDGLADYAARMQGYTISDLDAVLLRSQRQLIYGVTDEQIRGPTLYVYRVYDPSRATACLNAMLNEMECDRDSRLVLILACVVHMVRLHGSTGRHALMWMQDVVERWRVDDPALLTCIKHLKKYPPRPDAIDDVSLLAELERCSGDVLRQV